jgi:hypothetical protein
MKNKWKMNRKAKVRSRRNDFSSDKRKVFGNAGACKTRILNAGLPPSFLHSKKYELSSKAKQIMPLKSLTRILYAAYHSLPSCETLIQGTAKSANPSVNFKEELDPLKEINFDS